MSEKGLNLAETERLESPERDISQGYISDESVSDGLSLPEDTPLQRRIFSNQTLNLGRIKGFGFDMDYTLCEYISPQFDELAFNLAKVELVNRLNYSPAILDLVYNPSFPVRGLWFDKLLGNLLKVDHFGKILQCIHGFRNLSGEEIGLLYPHKIQRKDDSRIFVMNTLFNLAETHLLASTVDYMDSLPKLTKYQYGWRDATNRDKQLTFRTLFEDLRRSIDYIHLDSMELKKRCIADLPHYVKKDGRLPLMLRKIKEGGRKTFLLTNSDWWYTKHVMRYLLGTEKDTDTDSWLDWFDLAVVDGCKPRFFTSGNQLSRVDLETGNLLPLHTPLQGRPVYSGGDHITISQMLGLQEPEIIYCGDHLYADVVKCRKECEWRTLLIVPELEHEVTVTLNQEDILDELHRLEQLLAANKLDLVRTELQESVEKLSSGYGNSGSLFRVGSRLTYFGSQMLIWADLYTGSVNNLVEYNVNHRFLPLPPLLPHEHRGEADRGDPDSARDGLSSSRGMRAEEEEEEFNDTLV